MLTKVAALRIAEGAEQQAVAAVAGWAPSNWCGVEKGRLPLPVKRQELIAEYFGVPREKLFTKEGTAQAIEREALVQA